MKGGLIELERNYKDLSNKSKLEVLIFNCLLVYRVYRINHTDKVLRNEQILYEFILDQATKYQIDLSQEILMNFIYARFQLYGNELDIMNGPNRGYYIPEKIYSAFYLKPLETVLEIDIDFSEVMIFHINLTGMIRWIKDNANKI